MTAAADREPAEPMTAIQVAAIREEGARAERNRIARMIEECARDMCGCCITLDPHEFARLVRRPGDEAAVRPALPLPRCYTGGELEDGLYLWRRQLWPTMNWATFGVEGGLRHPYTGPATFPAREFVWLIGPIEIPEAPSEEASS